MCARFSHGWPVFCVEGERDWAWVRTPAFQLDLEQVSFSYINALDNVRPSCPEPLSPSECVKFRMGTQSRLPWWSRWLRLRASTAGGPGSILGRGTSKILRAVRRCKNLHLL